MTHQTIDAMEPRFDLRPGADGRKDLLLGQILLRGLGAEELSALGAAVADVLNYNSSNAYSSTSFEDRLVQVDIAICANENAGSFVVYLVQHGRYQQAFTIGEMNDLAALLKNELLNHSGEFGVACEGIGDGRYCATIRHGAAVVLDGLSQDDLGNLIDAMRRIRKATSVDGESLNAGAGQVVIIRSEDDGYTDAVYSIVANGRMVELTHEQFNAVIQALEQAYKAAVDTVLFPTFSSGIYFTKEYGAKTADSYKGRMASVALHVKGMQIDASTEKEAQLLHRLLCQLESGLGVLAWEPPTAELEAEQGEPAADETVPFNPQAVREYLAGCVAYWRGKRDEGDELAKCYVDAFQSVHSSLFGELVPSVETQSEPAADGITMLNGWLGASCFAPSSLRWFNEQPLTITTAPLALTINNIVAQLARLSAVAGIAWENQPKPFVAGGE